MFYFLSFCKKQKIIDENKPIWPKFCNIIILFLLKIGPVEPADQQINLVLPYIIYMTVPLSIFNFNATF